MRIFIAVLAVMLVFGGIFFAVHRARVPRGGSTVSEPPPASAPSQAGTYDESLKTADGRTRTYVLHLPQGYTPSKSYPLVVVLHGGYGSGSEVLEQSGFAAKADAEGFIVVAPDGTGKHWYDGNYVDPNGSTDAVDDVAFIRQLLSALESELPINQAMVYAAGISNGGHFTERLECSLPGTFAAIGTDVAPLPQAILDLCTLAPIPIVGIQGTADPLAPIQGGNGKGAGGDLLSATATMAKWAALDGCSATPSVTHETPTVNDGTSVDEYVFSGCAPGLDVNYYLVNGMGHGWPPSPAAVERISGHPSGNLNATDIFWSFFAAHPKPA